MPEGVVYSYTDRMIRFYCTNYYMNNQMRNFTLENPQEGYVILSANAQEEFLKNYNATYQHGRGLPYRLQKLRLTQYGNHVQVQRETEIVISGRFCTDWDADYMNQYGIHIVRVQVLLSVP